MAHLTNIPYLNNSNILYYLDMFAKDLLVQNQYRLSSFNVLVVGGSALALKYNFRGTVDIDADISFGGSISKSIHNVAKQCNIPSDWINQEFVKSYSYSRRIWDDALYVTTLQGYMNIYVVSDISQLCMKLTAGRDKDLSDIAMLVDKCFYSGISEEVVLQRFKYLYGTNVRLKQNAVRSMRRRYKYLMRNR